MASIIDFIKSNYSINLTVENDYKKLFAFQDFGFNAAEGQTSVSALVEQLNRSYLALTSDILCSNSTKYLALTLANLQFTKKKFEHLIEICNSNSSVENKLRQSSENHIAIFCAELESSIYLMLEVLKDINSPTNKVGTDLQISYSLNASRLTLASFANLLTFLTLEEPILPFSELSKLENSLFAVLEVNKTTVPNPEKLCGN